MMKKKFTGMFARLGNQHSDINRAPVASENESVEEAAIRNIKLFCESGSSGEAEGDEVLHLPVIVDSAESSPEVCAAAAHQIRKFLGKDYYGKSSVQYNAVMLIRILSDNPGPPFTKQISSEKFRETARQLLHRCQDPSVQQLFRETLNALENTKAHDGNLVPLMNMWRKEKAESAQRTAPNAAAPGHGDFSSSRRSSPMTRVPGPYDSLQNQQARYLALYGNAGQYRHRQPKQLPPVAELVGRIEEARTSARLLIQLTQSTPTSEVLTNELMREFAERCQSAQRNLNAYMNCTEPAPPDEDTFKTLIETCEQLSIASSKHQRAVLAARREMGAQAARSPPVEVQQQPAQHQYAMSGAMAGTNLNSSSAPAAVAPNSKKAEVAATITSVGRPSLPAGEAHDPFDDSNANYSTVDHFAQQKQPKSTMTSTYLSNAAGQRETNGYSHGDSDGDEDDDLEDRRALYDDHPAFRTPNNNDTSLNYPAANNAGGRAATNSTAVTNGYGAGGVNAHTRSWSLVSAANDDDNDHSRNGGVMTGSIAGGASSGTGAVPMPMSPISAISASPETKYAEFPAATSIPASYPASIPELGDSEGANNYNNRTIDTAATATSTATGPTARFYASSSSNNNIDNTITFK